MKTTSVVEQMVIFLVEFAADKCIARNITICSTTKIVFKHTKWSFWILHLKKFGVFIILKSAMKFLTGEVQNQLYFFSSNGLVNYADKAAVLYNY